MTAPDELSLRLRSLTAESLRPVPEYRTTEQQRVDALMTELVGTLARLFEPASFEDYAFLRRHGASREEAAARTGISRNTRTKYEARLRADREKAST